MCNVLGVSKSGFYAWCKSPESARGIENNSLTKQIGMIHEASKRRYGSPMITKELNSRGIKVSRPRVARLMRKAKIRSIVKKKFKITTDSSHQYPIVENILNRAFYPSQPGQAWVSDITYIKTGRGWLYLTIIMDLADRRIIGWSLSETMKASDTVLKAWMMALTNRTITQELIFHSDRGIQYACTAFTGVLDAIPLVRRSMSRKGNCWDNAVAESFFKTLKAECIYQQKFTSKENAGIVIFEYIEIWYNRKRRHSALQYLSPADFADRLNQQKIAA